MRNLQQQSNLDTHESAHHIGLASSTMRASRVSGILCGVPSPTYRKLGRKVIYDRVVLDEWLSQFANQSNTSAQGAYK